MKSPSPKDAPAAVPPGLAVQAQGKSMRSEILNVTARLITERGYSACTMRAVATGLNIKAGSLYYHFSSKDEIVEEILNTGIQMLLDEVQAQLDALPSSAGFFQKLDMAVKTHVSCMLGRSTSYMQVYEHLPPVLKRRSRAMRDKYAHVWFRLFEDGLESGEVDHDLDLRIAVPYLLGGLNRIPEWFRHARFREGDVIAVAASMVLKGIENRTASSLPVRRKARA